MKTHLLTLTVAAVFSCASFAQTNCNAGFESPVFTGTVSTPSNTLFTITVTAASPGTLTGISVNNTGSSNAQIKLCVYDDNAGMPGNLVASSAAIQLTSTPGPVTATVTPVAIAAGSYHVGAVIDQTASVIWVNSSSSVTLYATSMNFTNSFPATGAGFSTWPGSEVNIWMNITCSTSGINENNSAVQFSGYPSFLNEDYTMVFHSSSAQTVRAEFFNSCGELMLMKEFQLAQGETIATVQLSELSSGFYLLRIGDNNDDVLITRKLMKE